MTEKEYTIGRAQECNIKISCLEVKEAFLRTISRKHCKIVKTGSKVYLEDLSCNGTYVNGEIIGKDKKKILKNNDQISLVSPNFGGMCVNMTVT
jgi:serine/threonine-protein kinase Chk2